jgi:hypothetical protein
MEFQDNGNLIPGIFLMTIEDFEKTFGHNEHRRKLLIGLKIAIKDLSDFGCKTIYIDGSFVSQKELPNDFDCCWDHEDVDLEGLDNKHPLFFNFDNSRKLQKEKYEGEFFLAKMNASPFDKYLDFFQKDRDGEPKGIVQIKI